MGKRVKTPTVFQMEYTECGAACLAMVLAYFGREVSLERLRIETGVSRDGVKAANILRAAKKFGLESKGFTTGTAALRKMEMPCIIHWNANHFVVLEGFSGKYVYLNDPALGKRKITYKELDEDFSGVVMTFKPGKDFVKEKNPNTIRSFIKEHMSQKSAIAKLVAVGLLLVFPGLFSSVLSKIITDEVLVRQDGTLFYNLIVFIGMSALAQIFLAFYRGCILVRLQKKTVLLSARDFLYKMFRLPINFFDQRNAGELGNRVTNNAQVSDFLSGDLAETALNILVTVFYLFLMIIYNPWLTLIAVSSVAVSIIVMKVTSGAIANASIKRQQDAGKLYGALNSGLSITDSIKASGAETEYIGKILGYNAKVITTEQEMNKTQEIISAIPSAVDALAGILMLLVGGLNIIYGKMTIGSLVAFTTIYTSFSAPVGGLVGFVKKIQTTKADIRRVEDIEKRMVNVDICLCLLVPITVYKFDIDTTPVYLVQNNDQQDGNSDDGDTGQQELLATEQGTTYDIERVDVEHKGEEPPYHLPMIESRLVKYVSTYHWNTPDDNATNHPVNEHAQSVSQHVGANRYHCQPKNGEQQTDDVFLQIGNGPKQEGRTFAGVLHACEQETGTKEH